MIFHGKPTIGQVKLSKGQHLKNAIGKIADLEKEAATFHAKEEWLVEKVSYLVVAVSALGQHANLSAEEARAVIDKFIADKQIDQNQQIEVAKAKFKENIANGVMPENFTIGGNPDKAGTVEKFPHDGDN